MKSKLIMVALLAVGLLVGAALGYSVEKPSVQVYDCKDAPAPTPEPAPSVEAPAPVEAPAS